jgi:hypothetical protein
VRVDRSAFLVITATLGGRGCTGEPLQGRAVVAPTVDVPAVPVATAAPAPTAVAPGSATTAPSDDTAPTGIIASDSWPSSEGQGQAGAQTAAATATCGHSAKRFDPARTGCRDDVGSPASCSGMNATGSCMPFPFPREECQRWIGDYKPGVAERAVACARHLTGPQVCDACTTYRCGYEALMGACIDPSASSDCVAIHRACPSATLVECMGYLSGMSAAGRAKMVSCMSRHDECGWGLYSCSESL